MCVHRYIPVVEAVCKKGARACALAAATTRSTHISLLVRCTMYIVALLVDGIYTVCMCIFVKEDGIKKRIDLNTLKYVRSEGDYIKIFHGKSTTLVHETLTQFEVKLNHPSLIRIHRSTLVNLAFVDEINSDHLIIEGTDLTIGKTYRQKLQSIL